MACISVIRALEMKIVWERKGEVKPRILGEGKLNEPGWTREGRMALRGEGENRMVTAA